MVHGEDMDAFVDRDSRGVFVVWGNGEFDDVRLGLLLGR
jgi:hypothetical protein